MLHKNASAAICSIKEKQYTHTHTNIWLWIYTLNYLQFTDFLGRYQFTKYHFTIQKIFFWFYLQMYEADEEK